MRVDEREHPFVLAVADVLVEYLEWSDKFNFLCQLFDLLLLRCADAPEALLRQFSTEENLRESQLLTVQSLPSEQIERMDELDIQIAEWLFLLLFFFGALNECILLYVVLQSLSVDPDGLLQVSGGEFLGNALEEYH